MQVRSIAKSHHITSHTHSSFILVSKTTNTLTFLSHSANFTRLGSFEPYLHMFIDPLLWSSKITPLRLFSPSCLVDGITIGTANLLIGSIDKGSGDVVRYFSLADGPQLCHGLSCYLRPNAIKDEESGIRV